MSLTQVTPDVLHNIQSNVTQVGTLSNLTVSGNVSAGNVTATNFTGTASLANNASFLGGTPAASYALGSAVTTANTAMKGYVDAVTTAWTANAGAQASSIATLTSNAAVQAGSLATITANLGAVSGSLATLTSNAAVQAGKIATLESTTAKGFISFYPATGAVFSSQNLSVVRTGAGSFNITLAAGIQNGTINYAPMVGAISRGEVIAMGPGPEAIDIYGVGIVALSSTGFTVVSTRNYDGGIGFYGGGNDGNNVHHFAADLYDPARITVVVF